MCIYDYLPDSLTLSFFLSQHSRFQLHKGSYRPCPPGDSRRLALAIQHIFEVL